MEEILKEVSPIIKDILFYAYKNDISFPRSCGLVSNILTYFLKDTLLSSKYEVKCIRGVFKNIDAPEWCDDVEYEINRYNYESYDCICHNCGCCNFMNPHSWVELQNKENNKVIILDFTQIQFDSNFCDLQQEILDSNWNKEELFQYIEHNSYSLISETDIMFQYYIPLEKEISLQQMIKYIEEGDNPYCGMVINFLHWEKEQNN